MESSSHDHGRVLEVADATQYYQLISTAGTSLVVVDFFAQWCGPCTYVAPGFVRLSEKYQDVLFVKVDTDKLKSVATSARIQALPTFQLILQGQKIDELKGANINKLEELIVQYRTVSTASTTVVPNDPFVYPVGQYDLFPYIDKSQTYCLNENLSHTLSSSLDRLSSSVLKSDTDEQLLLYIPFSQPVKLHSLAFRSKGGNGPKVVKVFVNRLHLDFAGASSELCTQELKLTKTDLEEEKPVALKFVKFQNVNSLHLFVESNLGGEDITIIEQIRFIGQKIAVADMKSFQRVSGKKGETDGH